MFQNHYGIIILASIMIHQMVLGRLQMHIWRQILILVQIVKKFQKKLITLKCLHLIQTQIQTFASDLNYEEAMETVFQFILYTSVSFGQLHIENHLIDRISQFFIGFISC